MSLTGLPYLWQNEIERFAHPDLVWVDTSVQAVKRSYADQVAAAEAAVSGKAAGKVIVSTDPHRTTRVDIPTADHTQSVYVNPYTARVQGQLTDEDRLSSWTIRWHGGVPLNDPGSWAIELFACWAIVLFITGLYLWWPRTLRWGWGVLLPRLRSGKRIFWIDVHKVTGVWISLFAIGFLATGLPWTAFWGKKILKPIQQSMGHVEPRGSIWNFRDQSQPDYQGQPRAAWDVITDQVLAWPDAHTQREIIAPKHPKDTFRAHHADTRATEETNAQYDQYTGRQIAQMKWQDKPWSQKIVTFGINFHEGLWWGRINQIFNTLFVLVIMLVAISGAIIWWRRKPRRSQASGYPLPRGVAWPIPVFVGIVACLMPFFGASLLLILGGLELKRRVTV